MQPRTTFVYVIKAWNESKRKYLSKRFKKGTIDRVYRSVCVCVGHWVSHLQFHFVWKQAKHTTLHTWTWNGKNLNLNIFSRMMMMTVTVMSHRTYNMSQLDFSGFIDSYHPIKYISFWLFVFGLYFCLFSLFYFSQSLL